MIDGVSFSNMSDLLCRISGSFSSTTIRKLNPEGKLYEKGVESCLLKTFSNMKTLNKVSQDLVCESNLTLVAKVIICTAT